MEKVFYLAALVVAIFAFFYAKKPVKMVVPEPQATVNLEQEVVISQERQRAPSYDWAALRDLFAVDAQSMDPNASVVPASSTALPGNLKLVGVVKGDPSEIVVEDSARRETVFIKEGSQVNGLELISVNSSVVRLRFGGQEITLPWEQR